MMMRIELKTEGVTMPTRCTLKNGLIMAFLFTFISPSCKLFDKKNNSELNRIDSGNSNEYLTAGINPPRSAEKFIESFFDINNIENLLETHRKLYLVLLENMLNSPTGQKANINVAPFFASEFLNWVKTFEQFYKLSLEKPNVPPEKRRAHIQETKNLQNQILGKYLQNGSISFEDYVRYACMYSTSISTRAWDYKYKYFSSPADELTHNMLDYILSKLEQGAFVIPVSGGRQAFDVEFYIGSAAFDIFPIQVTERLSTFAHQTLRDAEFMLSHDKNHVAEQLETMQQKIRPFVYHFLANQRNIGTKAVIEKMSQLTSIRKKAALGLALRTRRVPESLRRMFIMCLYALLHEGVKLGPTSPSDKEFDGKTDITSFR